MKSMLCPPAKKERKKERKCDAMEYYEALQMEKILSFAIAWMNLNFIMLKKISQENTA
jgi:hypothetical protein